MASIENPKPNELLRYHRKLKQLTQGQLADELYNLCDEAELDERGVIDKNMVSKWERGENIPSLFWQKKMCQFFGKSTEELGFVMKPLSSTAVSPALPSVSPFSLSLAPQITGAVSSLSTVVTLPSAQGDWTTIDGLPINTAYSDQAALTTLPSTEQGNPMDRQAFLHGAAQIVGAALLMPNDELSSELVNRFIRALKTPSTINETTLRYFEIRTDRYWKEHYDAIFAASDLLSDVAGHFQKVTTLLEGSLLPTVRIRLDTVASRIAQLVGTLYFDMGNYAHSKKYKQAAILAAREANQQELEAVAWGRLSMACMHGGQLQEALVCIQESRRLARCSSNFTVHAWLAAVEAEIQAKLGNREACLRALDAAECVPNEQYPDQDSHWLHFDRPSLTGYQGVCYRRLYRPDEQRTHSLLEDARKALLTTLSLPTLAQRRPTVLADLADTYIQQGEVGEACRLASQAIVMTSQLQSGRNLQRLVTLRRDFQPWKDSQEVKDLDAQLAPLLLQRP